MVIVLLIFYVWIATETNDFGTLTALSTVLADETATTGLPDSKNKNPEPIGSGFSYVMNEE